MSACSLNKMHAMEGAAGNGKKVDSAEKTREDDSSRASPKVPQSQQNGAALPEETAAAPGTLECIRSSASIKKEPLCDSESEGTCKNATAAEAAQQKSAASRCAKSETEGGSRKRKSTDGQLPSNGNSTPKKFCHEQREQYITSLVGCEKVTAEELAARADQLRAEVQVNIGGDRLDQADKILLRMIAPSSFQSGFCKVAASCVLNFIEVSQGMDRNCPTSIFT